MQLMNESREMTMKVLKNLLLLFLNLDTMNFIACSLILGVKEYASKLICIFIL